MRMIERRIGLLFAGFLLCFLVVVGRAFWLQGVQGAELASEAAYQQTEVGHRARPARQRARPPRQRARRLRGRGDDLRHALPGREPAADRGETGADPRRGPRARCCESLTEDSGFSYVAQKVDMPTAARIERLELPGIGQLPDSRRTYPQGELAGQVIGAVGSENEGLTGLEAGEEEVLGGDRRRAAHRQGRARASRSGWKRSTKPSDGDDIQLTLDPAIQAKTEQVLAEVGETYAPKGATAIVMDPRSSRDPGDGQLAAGRPRPTSPAPAPRTCSTGPPASPTSRARPSRRSRSRRRWRKNW